MYVLTSVNWLISVPNAFFPVGVRRACNANPPESNVWNVNQQTVKNQQWILTQPKIYS